MPYSAVEKLSLAQKLALGIFDSAPAGTVGGKYWYSELFGWAPITPPSKLWNSFTSIPSADNPTQADSNVIANPTILEKRKVRLTVETTSNSRSYMPYSTYGSKASAMYTNWIQPSFFLNGFGDPSAGYIVRLYHGDPDSGGVEITTGFHSVAGDPAFVFSYSLGIISISTDEAAYFRTNFYDVNGLWITGYRYIGPTGGGSAGGGMTLDVTQANAFVQGDAIYLSSTGIWTAAQANNENTLGVALVSNPTPTSFTAIFGGPITGLTGKVAGQYYFVSDTVAGTLTTTEPGTFSNPLLLATTSTGGVVVPFRPSTAGILTVVLPELTTAQRVALTPFAVSGSLVIDIDLEKMFRKRNSIWVEV